VPLSEHEQRLLEQIERALLAEDPKFASTVRATDPRHYALRRVVFAAVLVFVGVGLMVFGLVKNIAPGGIPVLGILGFIVMFSAAVLGVQSYRRAGRSEPLRVVGSERKQRSSRGSGRLSLADRLEERWRRRSDGNGQQR
jgi:hypothetical protein